MKTYSAGLVSINSSDRVVVSLQNYDNTLLPMRQSLNAYVILQLVTPL